MKKNLLSTLLAVILLFISACGNLTSHLGSESESDSPSGQDTRSDEVLLEEAKAIGAVLVPAVMTYDLSVIQAHTVLDMATYEALLSGLLEVTDNGKFDWDGVVFDTFADFVTAFDERRSIVYQSLEVSLNKAELFQQESASEILQEALEIEKLWLSDTKAQELTNALTAVEYESVAKLTYQLAFQPAAKEQPDGTTEEYEGDTDEIVIYLIHTNGEWKSYSPNLNGMMASMAFLSRYLVNR